MRVLVACEFSGIVRDAFRARGHDAWSCDLLPCERGPQWHSQCDIREILDGPNWRHPSAWDTNLWAIDLMIAHPPCTYLSRAGARWWKNPERQKLADDAAAFVFALRDAPIPRICIENPIGQLNKRWRKPDQVIQPWMFGHPYSKATCLWLKNLPPLLPTVAPFEKPAAWLPSNTGANARKGGRTQRGVVHTAKDASRTFQGIAEAMADQWGSLEALRGAA